MASDIHRTRQSTIQLVFIIAASLLVIKAMQLQLFDRSYQRNADATAIQKYTVYPSRGLLYDREGNCSSTIRRYMT